MLVVKKNGGDDMAWEKVKLKDVCTLIVDCPHSTAPNEGKGYPLIRTPNIGRGRLLLDGVHRVSKAVYDRRNIRAIPQENDLIFAREATAGNVAIVQKNEKVCLGQRTVLLRPDPKYVDSDYLVYCLLAPEQQYNLLGSANGSTVAHVNLPVIRNLTISLPPLDVQKRIGQVLKTYDDLIENNRRQVRLLEEAAQRLYKEWFVKFHFPGWEETKMVDGLPVGWKKGRAEDFFDITIGKTPPRAQQEWFENAGQGVPWLSISDMGENNVFAFKTKESLTKEAVNKFHVNVLPQGTILVSFKLTVGRVVIAATDLCTNEAIAHFPINDEIKEAYTFLYLKNFSYDTLGSTSSISKAVNSKIIRAMPFIMPNDEILSLFTKQVAPIMKKLYCLQITILKLQEARDRLLPRLMREGS